MTFALKQINYGFIAFGAGILWLTALHLKANKPWSVNAGWDFHFHV